MSLEQNLADLQRHHDHFRDRVGFTYTVLETRGATDHADVIGCVYIYPDNQPDTDVHVQSWVREDRADLDALLATTVRAWLEERGRGAPNRSATTRGTRRADPRPGSDLGVLDAG